MVHNDKPYCQQDYMKMCGKKCSGCGEYISGEYINALDKEWHKSCFVCTVCRRVYTENCQTFLNTSALGLQATVHGRIVPGSR